MGASISIMTAHRNRYNGLDAAVAAEVRAGIARDRGVSVSGIAAHLGMRRATLSTRVNGHAPFSPTLLSAVAAELGTTASQIIERAEHALAARSEVAA